MPTITPKALFRGAASTSSTTIYTVPANTKTIVTDIIISNTSASQQTVNLSLNGVPLLTTAYLSASTMTNFSLKQVLEASNTITASASSTSVYIHISGVEQV